MCGRAGTRRLGLRNRANSRPGMRRRSACVRLRSGEEARTWRLSRWAKAWARTGWDKEADDQLKPPGGSWTTEMAGSSAEGQLARVASIES